MLQQELAHPPSAEFGSIDAIEDLENHVALVLYRLRRTPPRTPTQALQHIHGRGGGITPRSRIRSTHIGGPELRHGEPTEFRDIAGALRRVGLGATAPLRWALTHVSLERSTESRFGAIPHGLCDLGEAIAAPAQPLPGQCHPPPQ